ncbi:MAG: exodeoxyribonuclease I [Candidatus Saccharimonadales bacterium]
MAVEQTFFWYDLETTGINPREDRIMQFAGQRTDLALNPIDEPVNVLIKLSEDILPSPDAILITGITPQQTRADGVSEAEFLQFFSTQVATPGTIFVGFNSIRFDDEFMRYVHYRNFYDPYAWQWKDGRSRWDLLDVVRMTRALRPEGIQWPTVDGKPGNRLELLTKANNIEHVGAHDALVDVRASIELAKLIQKKQPKLFTWLLTHRDKASVKKIVGSGEPFVYSSGKYDNDAEKTTVAMHLVEHPKKAGALVYDLRYDPTPFLALSPVELAERWQWVKDQKAPPRLPVKTMQFNRCPAIAPIGVLDGPSQERIKIDLTKTAKHRETLQKHPEFTQHILQALELLDQAQATRQSQADQTVDARLYDGFFNDHDNTTMSVVRAAAPEELAELAHDFHDTRLTQLLPLYKARNFPQALTDEERAAWEAHRYAMIMEGGTTSRLARYMHRLQELAGSVKEADKRYLLEELQLYAESIMPVVDND